MLKTQKFNGYAKGIIVAIAIGGIIWNAATLHNDVKHLAKQVAEIKQELKEIRNLFISP